MEKLTREEKLQLCIKAKEMYERNKGKMGLYEVFTKCYNRSIRFEDWIKQSHIFEYIPELLHYKPCHIQRWDFWWTPSDSEVRLGVLDKLIKEFSK